jgi:carbohydrate kinase (thermoresistant glucokinase family)
VKARAALVMGVSGSGKSTIGAALARRLGWDFRDADSFHPPENVAKMASGRPLDDADRAPWLAAIAAHLDRALADERPCVVTCSALKRAYREVLIGGRPAVALVELSGDHELVASRMAARAGHFMPPALLASQFAALERPGADEHPIVVDIRRAPEAIVEALAAALAPHPAGIASSTRRTQ